ncbi:MAG: ABC transporter substrate-binding protein [Chloroflexi bacterium]|nr:ABC transporter substrate-binding protein [Chloroflexota bacterium]
MKKLLWVTIVLIGAGSILIGCRQSGETGLAPEVKTVAAPATPAGAAGWQEKWNKVLADARKEGTVTVYNTWSPEIRMTLIEAFKAKYKIDLEFSSFGRGEEMAARFQAENRAGLYLADFFGSGPGTMTAVLRPQGLLGPIQPWLILPEVVDPKVWRDGSLPFMSEGFAFGMIAQVIRTLAYNTDLVKEREITTYRDMLKPQYKGKITMLDPSTTGNSTLAHVGHRLWGEQATVDFLRRLITEQEVVITRDNRLHIETVARGKYAIAFAPSTTTLPGFLKSGAPLKVAIVEEDNRLAVGSGGFAVPVKFANPNATTVFINWLLTREGQTIFARGFGAPSARLDVPVEGIDPLLIPEPGKKYYGETPDWLEARDKWIKLAGEVMRQTIK